jgi:hypothetical protein
MSFLVLRSNVVAEVDDVEAPSWVDLMTVGTWAKITGDSPSHGLSATTSGTRFLSDVTETGLPGNVVGGTGPSAIIRNFGSAIFASGYGAKGGYIPWNGGHDDWHGNAVHALDLDTRTWSRLTNSYTGVSWPNSSGVWADGTPGIPHTTNALQYIERLNAMMTGQLNSVNTGAGLLKPGFFDFDTLDWNYASAAPTNNPNATSYSVYDADNDVIWSEGSDTGGKFSRYALNGGTGSGGTWTEWDPVNNNIQDQVAVVVPAGAWHATKPVLFINGFHNNTNVLVVDTTDPDAGSTVITQSGRPSVSSRHTWDWSEALQAVIYWKDGSNTVYKITKGVGTFTAATYTWASILNSGANTVTPDTYGGGDGGLYQRMRLCKWGSKEVLVGLIDTYSDDVFAFRIN